MFRDMSIVSRLKVTKRYILAIVGLVSVPFVGVGLVLAVGGSAGAILLGFFGGGAAGAAGGFLLGRRLDARTWASAGHELGLTPEETDDGALSGLPTLTGTVDGRRVRVSQESAPTGNSRRGRRVYTRVEVEMDPPAEEGVLAYRSADPGWDGRSFFGDGSPDDDRGAVDPSASVVEVEPFTAIGPFEEVARAVVSGRAREALLDADIAQVRVGDPGHAFGSVRSELEDVPMGSMVSGMVDRFVGGDPGTASNAGAAGLVVESDPLERQVRAVVAAADAYEEARNRVKQYG